MGGVGEVAVQVKGMGESIGQRGRILSASSGNHQGDSGRVKEEVLVGSRVWKVCQAKGLCLSFKVRSNFRELWAVEGSLLALLYRPVDGGSARVRERRLRILRARPGREEGAAGQGSTSRGEEVYTLDILKVKTIRAADERAQEHLSFAPGT